ncbi:MAG: helix-turn-helix domain-containing protein [Oligoflexia bacterium]|nr:helix-turn-helix domain-containing protein [Oligoflexia bacterium]
MTNKKLYSIKEAAEILAIKKSRLRTAIFRKEVSFVKIGRLVRFLPEQLEAWVQQGLRGQK